MRNEAFLGWIVDRPSVAAGQTRGCGGCPGRQLRRLPAESGCTQRCWSRAATVAAVWLCATYTTWPTTYIVLGALAKRSAAAARFAWENFWTRARVMDSVGENKIINGTLLWEFFYRK